MPTPPEGYIEVDGKWVKGSGHHLLKVDGIDDPLPVFFDSNNANLAQKIAHALGRMPYHFTLFRAGNSYRIIDAGTASADSIFKDDKDKTQILG